MQKEPDYIAVFLIVVALLIVLMVAFVITMLYLYTRKQIFFASEINQVKQDHAKTLMATQLEIQEETFQNISREIHDNITLSLTLCKLNLHTLDWNKSGEAVRKVNSSIELVSKAITDLSNISKSLNSEIISQQGLIKALEQEVNRIRQTGFIDIELRLLGNPVYTESQKDLIIFRIVQEALNNIIKHSNASLARLELNYLQSKLQIRISDNGRGFDIESLKKGANAGFKNMQARIKMLEGVMTVKSYPGISTTLSFTMPLD
jgi:two-component system, NarL family, sensor kinase